MENFLSLHAPLVSEPEASEQTTSFAVQLRKVMEYNRAANINRLRELEFLFEYCFFSIIEVLEVEELILRRESGTADQVSSVINFRVRTEHPPEILIQLIPHLLVQEYSIKPNDERYSSTKTLLETSVYNLYHGNIYHKFQKFNLQTTEKLPRDDEFDNRTLYLKELATCIVRRLFFVRTPSNNSEIWNSIVRLSKSSCCHVPEIGNGISVKRLQFVYYSNPPMYEYVIVDTNEKFTSFEADTRKATLLHFRIICQH